MIILAVFKKKKELADTFQILSLANNLLVFGQSAVIEWFFGLIVFVSTVGDEGR